MWNRLTSGFAAGSSEDEKEDENAKAVIQETQEQISQQNLVIEELKTLLRETEQQLKEKEKELTEQAAKHQRSHLQSKAKIASLTNQLKEKTSKKDDTDFDDASSSDSSDQNHRGRVILLQKQLSSLKKQSEKKEKEHLEHSKLFEEKISNLEAQLMQKSDSALLERASSRDSSAPEASNVQEMYAQIVYKDSKILELNNQLLEHERKIIDLQEHIREKDEVLQSRNLAVQLISADMSRKGKTVVDELEETREQMKNMQSNFADNEIKWNEEINALKSNISDLSAKSAEELLQKESVIENLKETVKKIEAARYELATRNAELQKKVVIAEENVDKQSETYRKKFDGELQKLRQELENEKTKTNELQATLKEATSQPDSTVFKARVQERAKLKALERELKALKQLQTKKQKPEEVTQLQQQVAVVEEEKGTLQLKLIEVDEQISMQDKLKEKNTELVNMLKEKEDRISYLEKSMTEVEAEKCNWRMKFEEQEGSYNILKSSFEDLNKQNVELNQNYQEVIAVKEELENKGNVMEQQISELSARNNDLSVEITSLKDEKVSLEMKVIELEELREGDAKEKNVLLNKFKALQSDEKDNYILQLEEEKAKFQAKCKELAEILKSSKNSNKESAKCIKNLETNMNILKAKLNSNEESAMHLQEENDNLAKKLKTSKDKLAEMEMKLKENDEFVKITESLETERNSLLIQLQKIEENKAGVQKENHKLLTIIKMLKVEISKLKDSHKEVSQSSKDVMNELSVHIGFLQKGIFHLNTRAKELEVGNSDLKELNASLVSQSELSTEEIHNLKEKIKELVLECEGKEQHSVALRDSFAKYEKHLQAVCLIVGTENIGDFEEHWTVHVAEFENVKRDVHLLLEQKQQFNEIKENRDRKIKSLTTSIKVLKEQLDNNQNLYKEEVLSLNNAIKELTEEKARLETIVVEKDNCISKLQVSLNEKVQLVKALNVDVTNSRSALSDVEGKLQMADQNISEQRAKQSAEDSKVQAKIMSLLEQIKDLESELSSTKEDLSTNCEQNDSLKTSVAALESELEKYKQKEAEYQKELEDKALLLDKFERQVMLLRSEEKEKNLELKQIRNILENTHGNELESASQTISSKCEKVVMELKISCDQIREENSKLRKEASCKEEQFNLLSKGLKEQLEESCVQLADVVNEKRSLESSLSDIKKELGAANLQISALKEKISTVDLSITEKDQLCESLLSKKSHLEIKVQHLMDENENFKLVVKEKSSELEQFQASLYFETSKIEELVSERENLHHVHADAVSNLETKLVDAQNSLLAKETELCDVKTKYEKLAAKCELLHSTIDKMRQTQLQIISGINRLIQQVHHLKQENLLLQESSKQSMSEFNNLYLEFCSRYEELEKELFELKHKLDVVEHEKDQLSNNNIAILKFQKECENEIQSLKTSIKEKEARLEESEVLLSQQKDDYSRLLLFKNKCFSLVSQLENHSDSTNVETADEEYILKSLENIQSAVTTLEVKLQCLEQDNENLQCKIQNIHKDENSTVLEYNLIKEECEKLKNINMSLLEENNSCLNNMNTIHEQVLAIKQSSDMQSSLTESSLQKLFLKVHEVESVYKRKKGLLQNFLTMYQEFQCEKEKLDLQLDTCQKKVEELLGNTDFHSEKKSTGDWLQELCDLLFSEINRLIKDLQEKDQQMEDYKEQGTEAECRIETLESKISSFERQNCEMVQNQQNYKNNISELHQKLEKEMSTVSVLQHEIEILKHKVQENVKTDSYTQHESTVQDPSLDDKFQQMQKSFDLHMKECLKDKTALLEELQTIKCDQQNMEKNYCNAQQCLKCLRDALAATSMLSPQVKVLESPPAVDFGDDFKPLLCELQKQVLENLKSREHLANEVAALQNTVASLQISLETSALKSAQTAQAINVEMECSVTAKEPTLVHKAEDILVRSANIVDEKAAMLQQENENLKQEINASKVKYDKALLKLKAFKNRAEKLTNEIKDLTSANQKLTSLQAEYERSRQEVASMKEEIEELTKKLVNCERQKESEIIKLSSKVKEFEERSLCGVSANTELKTQLQEQKDSFQQCQEVLNHQKEANKQLELQLRKCTEELENVRTSNEELQSKCNQIYHEMTNLREHTEMLISDNDTYQKLVETLSHSKTALEQELMREKESHAGHIAETESFYRNEMEKLSLLKTTAAEKQEKLITDMQCQCKDLQTENQALQVELQSTTRDKESLKAELASMFESLEQNKKLESLYDTVPARLDKEVQIECRLDVQATEKTIDLVDSETQDDLYISKSLEEESKKREDLEYQIETLKHDYQLARSRLDQCVENERVFKQEQIKLDTSYRNIIADLQNQIVYMQSAVASQNVNGQLEVELQQAMSSLHKQSLRCEELSLEVTKLLEERNVLKSRLAQYQQHFHQLQLESHEHKKQDLSLLRGSEKVPESLNLVKVEVPIGGSGEGSLPQFSHVQTHERAEIAMLHERLLETEKTCKELRKANEALDSALVLEKEQRKAVEEELGYAQKQLLPEDTSAKDEYRLLLGDFEEPEMLVERNFSITREVKTHAYKVRRWLKGRRSYLLRAFQRKNYSELLYFFYICAIHLWLLLCVFRHS